MMETTDDKHDESEPTFKAQLDARLAREKCPPARYETKALSNSSKHFQVAVWLDGGLWFLPAARVMLPWQFASFDHIRGHLQRETYTHLALYQNKELEARDAGDAEEMAAYYALRALPPSHAPRGGGRRTAARTKRRKNKKRKFATSRMFFTKRTQRRR